MVHCSLVVGGNLWTDAQECLSRMVISMARDDRWVSEIAVLILTVECWQCESAQLTGGETSQARSVAFPCQT